MAISTGRATVSPRLLAQHGVKKGDRVAVFLPNSPQFHIAFFGILKLGAVHVPVSPLSRAFELAYELNDTDAETIVALDTLMPVVREVKAETKLKTVFVTRFADVLPDAPTIPVPESLHTPPEPCNDAIDLMPALAAVKDAPPPPPASLDDIAALNYTGGTTGMPKGCVHTQRDMIYTAASNYGIALKVSQDSVFLSFLPEFWIAGENGGLIFPLFAGATLVLLARWDPVAVMTAVQRYRATMMVMPVDGAVELMDHPRFKEFDLSSLTQVRVVSFVKKLNKEYRARWKSLTGSVLAESSWGMTETHTSDTFTTGFQDGDFDLESQPVFVGLPLPGTEFKICDFETGALKPLGEEGEIRMRSPSHAQGLLEQAGGDAGGDQRRLAADRRHRDHRRTGLPALPRPSQGNAEGQGHERFPSGDRGRARPAPRRARLGRHRPRGSGQGPGARRLHPTQAGSDGHDPGRDRAMVPGSDGRL